MSSPILSPQYVHVSDGYEDHPERESMRQQANAWEEYLRAHPDDVVDESHPARQWLNATPVSQAWNDLMPSAAALYPLQRPETPYLFGGIKVDEHCPKFFMHLDDAIGIRTRASVMTDVVTEHFTARPHKNPLAWTSLACGAAIPIYNTLRALPSRGVNLSLVDLDYRALAFAQDIFAGGGISPDVHLTMMRRNLVQDLSVTDALVKEVGAESQDMVDMLGIFEYFKDQFAPTLLTNALKLLAPGGMLILANMLDTHPQININKKVIQWPKIYPRSLATMEQLFVSAGVDLSNVRVLIPTDGVYGVFVIIKD